MNMVKSVLLGGLALATSVFAEDDRKNICDELGTDVVNLKLAYVDETKWLGDFALTSAESHSTVRHETLDQMKAIAKEFPYKIPYSVDAGCLVQKQVTYSYLQWNESKKQWAENSENHDFATTILDIHGNRTETYDSTNAYNLLIVRAHNGNLDEEPYGPDELFVSKTYELAFESWFATAKTEEIKPVVIDGVTYSAKYSYFGYSMSQDSLKAVTGALNSVNHPEGVDKVELQIFHAIMKDPNRKIPVAESSSSQMSVVQSSSSAFVVSSSSAAPVASSSSEQLAESSSSESLVESSSSEMTEPPLVLKSLQVAPAIYGARQVRRLDGSVVKSNDAMKPGVYYVQGMDGLWKKQLVKTR